MILSLQKRKSEETGAVGSIKYRTRTTPIGAIDPNAHSLCAYTGLVCSQCTQDKSGRAAGTDMQGQADECMYLSISDGQWGDRTESH